MDMVLKKVRVGFEPRLPAPYSKALITDILQMARWSTLVRLINP